MSSDRCAEYLTFWFSFDDVVVVVICAEESVLKKLGPI